MSSKRTLCGGRFVVQRNVVWWSCCSPKKRCVVVCCTKDRCVVVVLSSNKNVVWRSFCRPRTLCGCRLVVQETVVWFVVFIVHRSVPTERFVVVVLSSKRAMWWSSKGALGGDWIAVKIKVLWLLCCRPKKRCVVVILSSTKALCGRDLVVKRTLCGFCGTLCRRPTERCVVGRSCNP